MFRITDNNGRSPEEAIRNCLQRIALKLQKSGNVIANAILHTTRNHVRTIYPNSSHYDPDKVTLKESSDGTTASGTININIPGICRAYHSHTITPIHSRRLTIPMHRESYGKAASQFQDLFYLRKKDGKEFLARNNGQNVDFLYFLAKKVYQKQDTRLMPSDETFAANISSRLRAYMQT